MVWAALWANRCANQGRRTASVRRALHMPGTAQIGLQMSNLVHLCDNPIPWILCSSSFCPREHGTSQRLSDLPRTTQLSGTAETQVAWLWSPMLINCTPSEAEIHSQHPPNHLQAPQPSQGGIQLPWKVLPDSAQRCSPASYLTPLVESRVPLCLCIC